MKCKECKSEIKTENFYVVIISANGPFCIQCGEEMNKSQEDSPLKLGIYLMNIDEFERLNEYFSKMSREQY